MIIYDKSGKPINLGVTDDSYSYNSVMSENSLTLYFSSDEYIEIPVGSYCDFFGERYTLKKESNFTKNGTRNFEYTLLLETDQVDLKLWKIRNPVDNRIKFSYTVTPREHLELLVTNANRRGSGWKVGECIEGSEKTIEYNHTYILDGLNQLADENGTEWQIVNKTIHLRKVEYNKSNPLSLSYGKGNGFKTGVGREVGDAPVEVLLVQGSDRNIDFSKYGAKELLLPRSKTLVYEGRTYITSADGLSVMRADKVLTTAHEDSLDCSEIYPSREGTVERVVTVDKENNFYDFIDSSIPDDLNFEDYLIVGENMTVIFQDGMLAGKEFEVKYFHEEVKAQGKVKAAKRFEIVPQEIDGITMPDGSAFMPQPGNKYAVFGIQLPDAYICDDNTQTGASWDMFREAVKYLYEHEDKKFTFTGTLDGIWAKKRWLQIGGKIILGGYVSFSDTQFQPDGILIRMTGIKRYVNSPYKPEIELSNTTTATSIASDLNKIETNEVVVEDKYRNAIQFTKRRFRDAQETMDMLSASLLNFSGSVNPITVATMQMLVGDESLQFRFVNSKTNPVQVVHNITYNPETRILNAPAGIIQHMTLGIDTLSSSHKVSEYKFWNMSEYNSPALIVPAKKYYLYAKVSKLNQTGTFILSETAIKLEGITDYYHLLVGVLNSEYDNDRSFVELYGFTEILPGRVTTEQIISPDGKTYFNLVKGEIGGNIQIKAGSSGLENLEEWEKAQKEIEDAAKAAEDAANSVDGLHDYVDGAFADGIITEAEAKAIEKYLNTVKNAKASVEATYNALYVNAYLKGVPKTNLLNAKINLFGAIENLIAAINTAISDGKTTVEEKKNVDNKFSLFNSSLANFNAAVEGANKAIQDELKSYSDQCSADLKVLSNEISAQVKRVDSITNRIDTAGWITTADGNRLYASKDLENGDKLISYINQAAGSTTIHSKKINLEGAVTITSLDSGLQGKINNIVSKSDLGSLAFKDAVEAAQLGSTIVVGGYLNTELIKVRRIDANVGYIGGFSIESGRLIWTLSDYFGGTSRSLKLGSGKSKEGVVNVTFNPATDGRFGVCAIGATAGGSAAIYGSSKTNPTYPNNYIYAGYFDGNVEVLGDVSANGFYPRDGNGNTMSVVSDSWIVINDMVGRKFRVVKGIIVEARG
ncbi:hypothetical protein ACIXT9_02465 [Bacteroides fragilis]